MPETRNDGNPENKSRNPKTRNYFSQKTKIRTVLSGAWSSSENENIQVILA